MIARVRSDLKRIKWLRLKVDADVECQNNHEMQLSYLKSHNGSEQLIKDEEKILDKLNILAEIEEADSLTMKYLGYINRLDPISKTIVTEHYLNGLEYFKIGWKVYYSESQLKYICKQAVEKIAEMIKESETE